MDKQESSDKVFENIDQAERSVTDQTVIRDGVSVTKSVSERTTSRNESGFARIWRCSLTIESAYDFPVAVQLVENLPAGHSAPNVAIPSDTADGWELQQEHASYSCFVEPGGSVRTTYLLYTDLPAREAFRNAPTIAKVQPVDPATVADGDDTPVWRGSVGAGAIESETSSNAIGGSEITLPSNREDEDGRANGAIMSTGAESRSESSTTDSTASRVERSERAAAESDVLVPRRSDTTPVVSVVMPTMNEEEGIAECIDQAIGALRQVGYSAEVIVSDSSEDDTPDIAARKGAHVVTPDREGYGYAYQYAFERARGDYIVIGDADTTYDFGELPKLFRRMAETDADIVMGSRLAGEIKPGAMPALHKYVGNPLLTKFLNMFYNTGVSDAHSGFRLIKREALDQLTLRSDGMEFASEMIMEAGERGLRIEEVPITYHERKGEATLDSFRDGWRHVRFMLVNAPGYLFSGPAMGLLLAGIPMMLLGFVDAESLGFGVPFGMRTMIAGSLLTIIGYQLGGLAVASSFASSPIRETQDPVTKWIRANFRLEHGATIGLGMFAIAAVYTTLLMIRWVESGYIVLPNIITSMVAFTAMVIGVQTVFTSFFLSLLSREAVKNTPADG